MDRAYTALGLLDVPKPPQPLCIDLFCGLGGWAEGFLAEGYDVVGFDIERRTYPGQLVLQNVMTMHGSQFRDAACIMASPPCTEYSYMAMPWSRGKQIAEALRGQGEFPEGYTGSRNIPELTTLFDACFRIQREASEAAGRYIPLVVENVKGTQPWVGPAKANYGSYYLWGDVESVGGRIVRSGPVQFGMASVKAARMRTNPEAAFKAGDLGWRQDGKGEANHRCLQDVHLRATNNNGDSWFAVAHNTESGHSRNPVTGEGIKQNGSGPLWFDNGIAKHSSKSNARREASALIAKIPYPLAQHIARCLKP